MRLDVTATRKSAYLYGLPHGTWMLYYTTKILGRQKDLLLAAKAELTEREARELCDGMAIEGFNNYLASRCN